MRKPALLKYFLFLIFFIFAWGCHNAFAAIKMIENKGQWAPNILYRANIPGGAYFIEKNAITYYFYDEAALHHAHHEGKEIISVKAHVVKVKFSGANPDPVALGEGSSSEYYNYFIGNDPSRWASGTRAYKQVYLKELWKGIDLEILCQDEALKYNFHLAAGADPGQIKLEYIGADSMYLKDGELHIKTTLNSIIEQKPIVLQDELMYKAAPGCKYELNGNILGFKVKNYSRSAPLIIDPTVIFATYSGSVADNFGFTATYDPQGHAYSGGTVYSSGFPTKTGAFQQDFQGGNTPPDFTDFARDAGILKYSPDGKQLLWATYLGGANNEQPHSMIIDHKGELVILGTTHSSNFPVTAGAYDGSYNGNGDIYVCKLSADGSSFISSTFIGGSSRDGLNGTNPTQYPTGPLAYNYGDQYRGEVIVDTDDNILIATCTQSSDFPIHNGIQSGFGGIQDGCVVKLTNSLNSILWSTFIGGSDQDAAYGINFDSKGNIFFCGGTQSKNFRVLPGAATTLYQGGIDGFICKLNKDGSSLLASTFVGTSSYDQNYCIQLDENDQVYVTGQTEGSFPVSQGVFNNANGKQYIAVFENDLVKMVLSTVFGSGRTTPDLSPSAFLVDLCGRICVSGWGGEANTRYNKKLLDTRSSTYNLTITPDAYQDHTDGSDFYLIILSRNFKSLVYSSYFGGGRSAEHVDGGTSRFDRDGKVYQSVCGGCGGYSDFPTTPGAWSAINNGRRPYQDDPNEKGEGCNNAVFKMDLNSSNFPPYFKDTTLVVTAMDEVNYAFEAYDMDISDSMFVTYQSDIFDFKKIPQPVASINIYKDGARKITGRLIWQTNCNHINTDTYFVYITLRDNGCPTPRITKGVIKIVVQPQPVPEPPGIFCIRRADDNTLKLEWDEFTANKYFENYKVVKRSPDGNETVVKTFSQNTENYYTDSAAIDHAVDNYCYFIYGTNKCGEIGDSTRLICSADLDDSIPDPLYMYTVTVEDNKNIRIIWEKNKRDDFYRYFLYKKENTPGSQYYLYKVLRNVNDTSFLDTMVDVQNRSYCYKLNLNTQCGFSSPDGNYGCSILLKGKSVPFENHLSWNEYKLWQGKVDHYNITRQDTTPNFYLAGNTSSKSQFFMDDKLNLNWGLYRYRVEAYEGVNGHNARSLSNEIILIQAPILRVPNAFTPNGNGMNDTWRLVPAFVKDYHLKVFNRWGQFVWETNDKHQQWDGWYKGFDPFDNVFIWQVTFTGWDRSINYKHGNVTILK